MKDKRFRFYSNYLGSWCKVTKVITDRHWWFYSEKHRKVMKAGTRLSYFKGQEDQRNREEEGAENEKN